MHCVKSVQIQSFFWSIFSCIQSKYGKIRTRKNSIFGYFSWNGGIFGVEHITNIPREVQKFIGTKITKLNIHKIHSYDSTICGYFCLGFVYFMLNNNRVTKLC